MKSNLKFFNKKKLLPVDKFFFNVLYDKKSGYYTNRQPFGGEGDFITAPKISNLFSEIIAIWIISSWQVFGKPKNFNVVELGPGDGSLTKVLLKVFKNFPEFNKAKKMYLYEISSLLKKLQKKNIENKEVKWVKNFKNINNGPIIFFGNEFFDAIPIKQFKNKKGFLFEKYYKLNKDNKIEEIFKKALKKDALNINSYKSLRKLKFIEFPKYGFEELKRIIKKILEVNGCLLLIDYGYTNFNYQNTLQSVMSHKKNNLLDNLGRADVTSLVNFSLIKNYLRKNKLKVNGIVTQEFFLKRMGIINRAEAVAKRMNFKEKSDLYFRIQRLIGSKQMGELFKFLFAFKLKDKFSLGFY